MTKSLIREGLRIWVGRITSSRLWPNNMSLNRGVVVGSVVEIGWLSVLRVSFFLMIKCSNSVLLWETASSPTLRFYASGGVCSLSDSVGRCVSRSSYSCLTLSSLVIPLRKTVTFIKHLGIRLYWASCCFCVLHCNSLITIVKRVLVTK